MVQFPICGTKMKKLLLFCALFCISGLWEQSTLAVMCLERIYLSTSTFEVFGFCNTDIH